MQRLYFLIIFLFPLVAQAQLGCTDPNATNFDPDAQDNDGTCVYPETIVSTEILSNLPDQLPECSGMVAYEDYWLTINDSGGGNDIHILDRSTGDYIRKVEILGATNVDWESLTIYQGELYIGDTGNNIGNRMDLGVYKIALADINQDEVTSTFFPYKYEDQIDFDPEPEAHPFDCEAIIVNEQGIHLFTKGWNFGMIGHYLVDINAGSDNAIIVDEINLNGLVTGAHIDENGTLGFTGTDGNAFLWLFFDYQVGAFFSGNKRKIGLGFLGQNESLYLDENQTAWITSEDTFQPGKIFFAQYGSWIVSKEKNLLVTDTFDLFPNPYSNSFQVDWEVSTKTMFNIHSLAGQLLMEGELKLGTNVIEFSNTAGAYLFTTFSNGLIRRKLIIQQ